MCVAIELKRQIQQGAEYLEVNDVRSFHGREFKNIVEPIANNGSVRKLGCKQQAYAHSFVNLKRKKGISATPLNWLLNAFTLALNDSAPALVCLFTK